MALRLENKLVLNSRPRADSAELSERLRAVGANVLEIPCLEIVPSIACEALVKRLESTSASTWLIFTSANAVRIVAAATTLAGRRIAVIGEKTAAVAREHGAEVGYVAAESNSEGFARGFLEFLGADASSTAVLLLRGRIASEVIADALRQAGAQVDSIVIYDSRVAQELSCIDAPRRAALEKLSALTFTSSAAVRAFVSSLHEEAELLERLRDIPTVVIGPRTATTTRMLGFRLVVGAARPGTDELVQTLCRVLLGTGVHH
jgi:uroporphyrinogen-III synthase